MKRRGPANTARSQVRIIGGQWKRTPMQVVDVEGLRPTPDRVRETLFNWLNHLLEGRWNDKRFLDLFAGTGVLGFEAASRGAMQVVQIESDARAVQALQRSRDKLGASQIDIRKTDAMRFMQTAGEAGFDVIFIDPPYSQRLLPTLLPACARLLETGGLVYAESDEALQFDSAPWLQGFECVRSDKAGTVHFCLLQCIKVA